MQKNKQKNIEDKVKSIKIKTIKEELNLIEEFIIYYNLKI